MERKENLIVSGEKGKLMPVCSICRQVPAIGMQGGMKIKKGYLCYACEKEIVSISADTADYRQIVEKIKAIII